MSRMSTYNIHSCGFDRNLFRVWIDWFEFILRCCSQSCWSCPIKHSAFPALDLYTSFNPIEFHWMITVCSMLTLSSLCGLFFLWLFVPNPLPWFIDFWSRYWLILFCHRDPGWISWNVPIVCQNRCWEGRYVAEKGPKPKHWVWFNVHTRNVSCIHITNLILYDKL